MIVEFIGDGWKVISRRKDTLVCLHGFGFSDHVLDVFLGFGLLLSLVQSLTLVLTKESTEFRQTSSHVM